MKTSDRISIEKSGILADVVGCSSWGHCSKDLSVDPVKEEDEPQPKDDMAAIKGIPWSAAETKNIIILMGDFMKENEEMPIVH